MNGECLNGLDWIGLGLIASFTNHKDWDPEAGIKSNNIPSQFKLAQGQHQYSSEHSPPTEEPLRRPALLTIFDDPAQPTIEPTLESTHKNINSNSEHLQHLEEKPIQIIGEQERPHLEDHGDDEEDEEDPIVKQAQKLALESIEPIAERPVRFQASVFRLTLPSYFVGSVKLVLLITLLVLILVFRFTSPGSDVAGISLYVWFLFLLGALLGHFLVIGLVRLVLLLLLLLLLLFVLLLFVLLLLFVCLLLFVVVCLLLLFVCCLFVLLLFEERQESRPIRSSTVEDLVRTAADFVSYY